MSPDIFSLGDKSVEVREEFGKIKQEKQKFHLIVYFLKSCSSQGWSRLV